MVSTKEGKLDATKGIEYVFNDNFVDETVARLLKIFEELTVLNPKARVQGNQKYKGWRKLATYLVTELKEKYPDEKPEPKREYLSAINQWDKIRKSLLAVNKNQLEDVENIYKVRTVVKHFVEDVTHLWSPFRAVRNERNKATVLTRAEPENRLLIDFTPYLLRAEKSLRELDNWLDVSCALSLVCGRRMAEIHLSGIFEVIGEYELMFSGQLKGKNNLNKGDDLRDKRFPIPTLVKAQLVLDGIAYLENYKYFGESQPRRFSQETPTTMVNRSYSKVLSARVKEHWDFVGNKETVYHRLRAAYLRMCVENLEQGDLFDDSKYAYQILGDGNDATAASYKRYQVIPGTLTKV